MATMTMIVGGSQMGLRESLDEVIMMTNHGH